MEKDNLPLGDHSLLIGTKLKIILFQLDNQNEKLFLYKKATIPANPFQIKWSFTRLHLMLGRQFTEVIIDSHRLKYQSVHTG